MGIDHKNSNDFGKGADIFNDIPKMIDGLIPTIKVGIEKLQEVKFKKANLPDLAPEIVQKVKTLEEENSKFFKNRENRRFRTCGGGKGDPENDKKYSAFKTELAQNVKKLFEVDITALGEPEKKN